MTTGNQTEALMEQICALAKSHSLALIEVVPTEPKVLTSYEVNLDPEEFLEVMSVLRPRIIYVETSEFSAKWQIGLSHDWAKSDEHEGDEGDDPSDDDDEDGLPILSEEQLDRTIARFPEIKAAVKKWSQRDGQKYMIEGLFFVDGVYHTMSFIEDWMDDFHVGIAQLKVSHLEEAESAAQHSRAMRRTAFAAKAEHLANDPMFTAPKATRERREYLASRLYPDLDEMEWAELVAEAANIVWYRTGGDGGGKQR